MVFARFHHIYTHRFESAYGDESTLNLAKREWAMTLAGTPTSVIEMALERCKREFAWPPTIAEFLKLCQPDPESLGLPPVNKAYQEASQNSHRWAQHHWSHDIVLMAARNTGFRLLRSEPERTSRPLFEKHYRALIERIAGGETIEVAEFAELPAPEIRPEEMDMGLIATLEKAGVPNGEALRLAYYQEKPKGSPVRAQYRRRSQQWLTDNNIDIELPN